MRSLAKELARQGHSPLVVTLGTEPGWSSDGGVRVLTLPEHFRVADILGFPGPGTRRRLTRLLRDERVDVVSVHTRFFPMSFVGSRAARRARLPLVHTEHGSDHVSSDSAVIRIASRVVDFTLGRAVLRSADRVLGVSENVVAFVHKLADVDAQVLYNAIDPTPVDTAGQGSTPSGDRPNHLVFVGRLVAGKGWRDFLSAVAELQREGHNVTAEVLGDGPDRAALEALVDRLGLQDSATIRGRVTQDEVRRSVRGATLVNPTTLSEGFQTTLLEALAEHGRVVTYDVPGARTLQDHGAPVSIAPSRDQHSLVATLREALESPGDPAPDGFIDEWTWPARARQFAGVCATLRDSATTLGVSDEK